MRTLLYGPQPSSATPASAGLSPASGKNCRPRDKACRWSLPAILCKPLNQLDFVIATRWPAGCRRQAGPSRSRGSRVSSMSSIAPDLPAAVSLTSQSRMQASSPDQDTDSQPFSALLDAATSAPPSPPPAPASPPAAVLTQPTFPSPQPAQQPSTPTSAATGDSGTSDTGSSQTSGGQNQGRDRKSVV